MAPLLVFVHGGGWVGGDKSHVERIGVLRYLQAGISVAAVNYRRVTDAAELGIDPPVEAPMKDVARAIQTLRSRAAELGVDKTRFAITGASAGGCTSLWIAFHDDLATPASSDPVARESTRVIFAAALLAQTSLDPHQLRDWIPDIAYGGHAFGFLPRDDLPESFQRFWESRERLLPDIRRYSPYGLVSNDDPPVLLLYSTVHDATHSPAQGTALKVHLDDAGVSCEFRVTDRTQIYESLAEYVIGALQPLAR